MDTFVTAEPRVNWKLTRTGHCHHEQAPHSWHWVDPADE
jgi:hypothetical protein